MDLAVPTISENKKYLPKEVENGMKGYHLYRKRKALHIISTFDSEHVLVEVQKCFD